ncbi:hypothetical protein [uncultured Sunxiuqinia sp.]|uniref:hypothetical protein n=1 Tax=uncultured Sunxiuqinia sp. TaxID=1573825 RepID=UPI00261580F1|nr:hypothetical protein [uncultured Sunxiuqinia sp.]
MKQIVSFLIVLVFTSAGYAQISIQQIAPSGIESFQGLMGTNQDKSNVAELIQAGDDNQAFISQTQENQLLTGNQTYGYQEGTQNSMNFIQEGNNNTLLSFQMNYLSTLWNSSGSADYTKLLSEMLPINTSFSMEIAQAENNSISGKQTGQYNGLITLQAGKDNQIYTTQTGINNYLLISQLGQGHLVQDFLQQNQSAGLLVETISQTGSNNMLEVTNASSSQLYGNHYSQTGENLSLQVNSSFLSTTGGMEVTQTGQDMKVIIDQSYFPTP